jgi:hypothetical protein
VFATPSGCWVNGCDGAYRILHGQPAEKVFDGLGRRVVAVNSESALVHVGDGKWELRTPGSEPVAVQIPPGLFYGVVVDGDGFVGVHQIESTFDADVRLVRVTGAGDVTIGPVLPAMVAPHGGDRHWVLAGSPLRLFCGSQTAVVVREDLSADSPIRLPENPLSAGPVGDLIWVVTHPPHADSNGLAAAWPLSEPTVYDTSRGQFWLLTLLDSHTLSPVGSFPVHETRPKVARSDDGTIWTAGNRLHALADNSMQWSRPIDIDPMITATIDPFPPERPIAGRSTAR